MNIHFAANLKGVADQFTYIADFIFESVVFDELVGQEHAEAVLAEAALLHAGVEKQVLEVGWFVAVLLHLHDDKVGDVGIALRQMVVEMYAAVDGDALGAVLVD